MFNPYIASSLVLPSLCLNIFPAFLTSAVVVVSIYVTSYVSASDFTGFSFDSSTSSVISSSPLSKSTSSHSSAGADLSFLDSDERS